MLVLRLRLVYKISIGVLFSIFGLTVAKKAATHFLLSLFKFSLCITDVMFDGDLIYWYLFLEGDIDYQQLQLQCLPFGVPREFYLRAPISELLLRMCPQLRRAPVLFGCLGAVTLRIPLCSASQGPRRSCDSVHNETMHESNEEEIYSICRLLNLQHRVCSNR